MEKRLNVTIESRGPKDSGRYWIEVVLPPCPGVRRTSKTVVITTDSNADMNDYTECVNVAATGDLAPEEIPEFCEALDLARRLADGTLVIGD